MIAGLHFVRMVLATGVVRWYVYAWRGGPLIMAANGHKRPALNAEALRKLAKAQNREPVAAKAEPTLGDLMHQWRGGGGATSGSPEWQSLAASTRKTWGSQADAIQTKWGRTTLAVWNDPRMVAKAIAWRDSRKDTPRAADIGVTVLKTLLEFGRLRGMITINAASRIPSLYRNGARAEIIWTDNDIERFVAIATTQGAIHIADGLRLAALTGLRRQDLVTLTWDQVGEHALQKKALKQSRRKRRHATIPRIPQLSALLDELGTRPRRNGVNTVLVNSFGQSWSGDGFGGSFNRIRNAAGIVHVDPEAGEDKKKHLHDVRGTFCTKLILAGLTDQEAADIMGWSPDQVSGIRRVYVDQARVIVAIGERIANSL